MKYSIIKKIRNNLSLGRRLRSARYKLDNFLHAKGLLFGASLRYFKKIKGSQRGKRVFLIGNGPSLTKEDLNLLKDEICIAANKIYLIFGDTDWRPTYYCIQDRLILEDCASTIKQNISCPIFTPRCIDYKLPNITGSYKYNLIHQNIKDYSLVSFSSCPIKGFYFGDTVMYTMIQLAVFMGFSDIILIGVDFNQVFNANSGVTDLSKEINVKHFHKDYFTPGQKLFVCNRDLIQASYDRAEAATHGGDSKIWNATRGGMLESFTRVDLEKILMSK